MSEQPAFPVSTGHGEKVDSSAGMSLRDYIAAKAMAVFLKEYSVDIRNGIPADENWKSGISIGSYSMADAMIEARKQS